MATLIIAAVLSAAWCWAALWIGPRTGYVDQPGVDPLKIHDRVAVPLGGVGVFLGYLLAGYVGDWLDGATVIAASVVLVLGLIDDRWGLPPLLRLSVELGAAALLMIGIRESDGSWLFFALGVVLVVFAINAVNLFDGLDGLAGSVALVAAVALAVLLSARGAGPGPALGLAGGLAGFLVLGWPPARVFLGDAGAYVVAVCLSSAIVRSSTGEVGDLLLATGLLGVFAIDLVVTLIRRLRNDRPLFEGDRSHVYDQMRDRGLSTPKVIAGAVAVQVVFSIVVISADRLSWAAGGVVALLVVAVTLLVVLGRTGFLAAPSR